MTKKEIIDALAPSIKPEILTAIQEIFDRDEQLMAAARIFHNATTAPKLTPTEQAINIENKIDSLRSNPKYMFDING